MQVDLIFTYKLVFGLTDLNLSDFFSLRSDERNRGHKYKRFLPSRTFLLTGQRRCGTTY